MGRGCKKCGVITAHIDMKKTTEQFIRDAREKHGDLYDYSKVVYTGATEYVTIICPKPGHDEFPQAPYSHTSGAGCPRCRLSHLERTCLLLLNNSGLFFETGKRFDDCCDDKPLPFDFFIPSLKIIIELDGGQHFKVGYFKSHATDLEKQKLHDKTKNEYCKTKEYHLLRISYSEMENIESIVTRFINDVLEAQKSGIRLERFVGNEYNATA